MPKFQTMLAKFNTEFSEGRLEGFVRQKERFGPGTRISADFFTEPGTALHRSFTSYLNRMPGVMHETLRSAIHYALSTEPPTQITFAWAPAYDYEVTYWQAPDTEETKGGITVLLKSRYPDDRHPLDGKAASTTSA